MASAPILSLREISLRFGAEALFTGASLAIAARERLCLVGRNGCGKTTLLKLVAGDIEADSGARWQRPGLSIATLAQRITVAADDTVAAFVAAGSDAPEHAVAAALAALGLDADARFATLSGGEARRAALARALAGAPDLLLLDEPTNQLDLPAIEWLEAKLAAWPGAVIVVSHDRALLARVATRTAWLDRGRLRLADHGFAGFEPWQERVFADEARAAERLGKHLAAEIEWLRKGVTARRRRNQGRLRKLEALRAERRRQLARTPGASAPLSLTRPASGARVVVEADAIAKRYAGRSILAEVSLRIRRGDRVAITGANGAGKTTLLQMLTGRLAPDAGSLRLGDGIVPAVFEQDRAALDPEASLWATLCPQGGDTVWTPRGYRHVVGFLQDFLFDPGQAKSPVGSLSGGEQARLLLAMLFARPSSLIALDEPTNDLDLETLDLLQDALGSYDGAVLLVSHDRAFIDRLATHTLWLNGDGGAEVFVGGHADMVRQRGEVAPPLPAPAPKRTPAAKPKAARRRLGYKDQRELDSLPARIAALAAEIAGLEARLADPALYARDAAAFADAGTGLAAARPALAAAEARWLELAERDEALRTGS